MKLAELQKIAADGYAGGDGMTGDYYNHDTGEPSEWHPGDSLQWFMHVEIAETFDAAAAADVQIAEAIRVMESAVNDLQGAINALYKCWDSPQEMAEGMLDDYKTMKEHLQKALAGGELRKAYVIVPIFKGLLQGEEVKVTFCQDKALKLRAATDERLGIVRDEDDHYDSESDVHMEVVDIVW